MDIVSALKSCVPCKPVTSFLQCMKFTANLAKVSWLNAVPLPSPKVYAFGEQRTLWYLLAGLFVRAFAIV